MITLRSLDLIPEELRDAAIDFWAQAGRLLNEILGGVARSLGLEEERLVRFSEPGVALGREKMATMLRLFRYEGEGAKIVAEGKFVFISFHNNDW